MKKKLALIILAILLLTSCNKDTQTQVAESPNNSDQTETKTPNDADAPEVPEEEIPVEAPEEVEKPIETNHTVEEEVKILEENSDYISIIKMSQTGSQGKEIHVVEDIKGSIKSIIIPDIPNMEPNYNYLVFLMDSESGDIALTDIDRGLIKIDGENEEYLNTLKSLIEKDLDGNKNN